MCVTLPVRSCFETGPYVLLSRLDPGGPSPSTQTWPCGTRTVGSGCGGFVLTTSFSRATTRLTAMTSGCSGLLFQVTTSVYIVLFYIPLKRLCRG